MAVNHHWGAKMTVATESSAPKTEQFKFFGKAGEFFGIWFVNNMLMMITLGFYSPWAKIRTLQYFYGNTELAGSSFQFTANPWALLRTRVIAVLLLILYLVSDFLNTTMAAIVFASFIIGYFVFAPILLVFMLSFRTRYSVWRGVSFRFVKDYAGAYRVYLAPMSVLFLLMASLALPFNSEEVEQTLGLPHYEWPVDEETESNDAEYYEEDITPQEEYEDLLTEEELELLGEMEEEEDLYINPYLFIPFGVLLLIYGALLPYFDFISNRFIVRNSRFGNGAFSFSATVGDFYRLYGKWFAATAVLVLIWVAAMIAGDKDIAFFPILMLLTIVFVGGTRAYFQSRRTNILLQSTRLAQHHQLAGYIPFRGLFWLMVSNNFMVAITLGLMGPWAKVRTARFMLERIQLVSEESLDGFVEQQSNEASSLAEEVADVFDLDLV